MFYFITKPRHEISSFSCLHNLHPYKKDKDRRKCKGRRCSFGGRIDSVPCRASYFASVDFEEKDELILIFQIIPHGAVYPINQIVQCKQLTWQGTEQILTPKQKWRPLAFLLFFFFLQCSHHIRPPSTVRVCPPSK